MITVELAAEIAKRCVVPPHKLPEPLHLAHRFANKALEKEKPKKVVQEVSA
jgi:hypothetical protein